MSSARENTYSWGLAEGTQKKKNRLCFVRLQIWHEEEVLLGLWGLQLTSPGRLTNTGVPTEGGDLNPGPGVVSEDLGDYDYADLSFSLSLIPLIQKTPAKRCKNTHC